MVQKPEIKICGLTSKEEVEWVVKEEADYAGFVLFFPKSKRNLTKEQAEELLEVLAGEKTGRKAFFNSACKRDGQNTQPPYSVAVVVSPTPKQVSLVKEMGFDYIQIHGTISAETLQALNMPVIRAINIGVAKEEAKQGKNPRQQMISQIESRIESEKKLLGQKLFACLFDAAQPGSGKAFDWELLAEMKRPSLPLFLAGGLDSHNVAAAVRAVRPDAVDVSSGVEKSEGMVGKERAKIIEFMRKVRTDE